MVKTSTIHYSLHTLGSKAKLINDPQEIENGFEQEFLDVFSMLNKFSVDVSQHTVNSILKYATEK